MPDFQRLTRLIVKHALVTLAALAISFTGPGLAQQTDTANLQLAQQLDALGVKFDEIFNKNDAAQITACVDPPHEGVFLSHVRRAQFTAMLCPFHRKIP